MTPARGLKGISSRQTVLILGSLLAASLFGGCAAAPPSDRKIAAPPAPAPEKALPEEAPPPVEKVLSAGEYLQRGRNLVGEAQDLREGSGGGSAYGWLISSEEYGDIYGQAAADFQSILDRYPDSPAAAEAQYLLGLIHDYHHLENFEVALEHYRLTVERYPGTAAASRAGERKAVIEDIMRGLQGTSHEKP